MSQVIDPLRNVTSVPEFIVQPSLIVVAFPLGERRFRTWDVAQPFSIMLTPDRDGLSSFSDVYLEPQDEGGFVAFSKEYAGAIGQGETEEEAIADLQDAIKLLKEVLEEDRKPK